MMIYLTGAGASLARTTSNPQSDPVQSLGGYVSSTPVPNDALNSLFDLLSSYTLEKKQKETIAVALINKFDYAVKDVELKLVTDDNHEAIFKVAAVGIDKSSYMMEHISSRYQEPMNAEFHDASFYRAAVEFEINNPAISGEEIVFSPFNVVVDVSESGMEGTWDAIEEAFCNNETYFAKRVNEKRFRIERRDETVLTIPLNCSFLTSESFSANFLGKFENKTDNSVLIKDVIQPGEAIGIWIQRIIKKNKYPTNEELINEYLEKYVRNDSEEVEMVISYNLVEDVSNYNTEYKQEDYS